MPGPVLRFRVGIDKQMAILDVNGLASLHLPARRQRAVLVTVEVFRVEYRFAHPAMRLLSESISPWKNRTQDDEAKYESRCHGISSLSEPHE